MKRKWALFTYPVMDIKAAEAMLNERAAEGWRLEKIWLGLLVSFVPAAEPVRYCLDWYDPSREDGVDYRTLLADAGWRPVGQLSYWNIYEAPAGTAPIQTDVELEYRRFRKKALRRMVIGWSVPLIFLALLVLLGVLAARKPGILGWRFFATVFTDTTTGAIVILLLPLLLAGGLLWSGRLLLRMSQWRRAVAQGEPFPVPKRGSALAARLCTFGGYLLLVPIVLAFLLDAMSGVLNLGWVIGLTIGCLIVLGGYPRLEHQRKRRYVRGTLACAAVLLVLRLLPLSGVAGMLCVQPPLADAGVLPERAELEALETRATILAARTERREFGPLKEGDAPDGVADSQVWKLPWPWLAGWVTEQYLDHMDTSEELPGYEDVWLVRRDVSESHYPAGCVKDTWLIRRGNTVLWVETDMGPLDEEWLDGILARLEVYGA